MSSACVRAIVLGMALLGHNACAAKSPSAPDTPAPRTLTVSGLVRDSAWRSVEGARIDVTVGGNAGTFVLTNAAGQFILSVSTLASGVFALEASRSGFTSDAKTFAAGDYASFNSAQSLNALFQLTETAPLLSLGGDYSALVSFDPSCEVPPSARTRSYEAAIEPATDVPSHFKIDLQSAALINEGTTMDAVVASAFARFFVFPQRAANDEALPFVERIDPNSFVAFAGTATADVRPTDRTISARLDGWVSYCRARPTTNPYSCPDPVSTACHSPLHQLILTRR
jgi:hypothetical protein